MKKKDNPLPKAKKIKEKVSKKDKVSSKKVNNKKGFSIIGLILTIIVFIIIIAILAAIFGGGFGFGNGSGTGEEGSAAVEKSQEITQDISQTEDTSPEEDVEYINVTVSGNEYIYNNNKISLEELTKELSSIQTNKTKVKISDDSASKKAYGDLINALEENSIQYMEENME